jgi:phosphoribosylamine--glycine ligase
MKVCIIGNGAREHALSWKYSESTRISGLHIVPGNGGTADLGINHPEINPLDFPAVVELCRKEKIELVFVGPEIPLAAGISDALTKAGIAVIGPGKEAAQLEGSKEYSKNFMLKHKIPTAAAETFTDMQKFESYIKKQKKKIVIKKSGLAAGKGVLESDDHEKILNFASPFFKEGDSVLVEEFLTGYEISVFVLTDGKSYKILPYCADFKKAGEGDTGLNTGGMGAVCPVPFIHKDLQEDIEKNIVQRTIEGLNKDNLDYKGVIYIGLMITESGPKVLEYNVRFGDPEAQVLLPLIKSDFANLSEAIVKQRLDEFQLQVSDESALCVVIAAEGYPGPYKKGIKTSSMGQFRTEDALIFHASTTRDNDNNILTGGGRCFSAVGFGNNLLNASRKAYKAAESVEFDGAWFRSDIGKKFFIES